MGLFSALSKAVAKKAGDLIKKTNQRLFEIAKNYGTNSAVYQDNVDKIEALLGIDMKLSNRKSKGVEVAVYQIPNTASNKEIISNPTQYKDWDGRNKNAEQILESVDWVHDIRQKYTKKVKQELGKTSRKDVDAYIREYQTDYIPLLREKMQLFYKHNASYPLKEYMSGMTLNMKIDFLRSLDPEKELPASVNDMEDIRNILQEQGRSL